jgi:hypothetical protein
MNLMVLKEYLKTVKITSMAQIAQHFNADPQYLRNMLHHWVGKGKLRRCSKKEACGTTCFQCDETKVEIYEWVPG